MELQIRTNPQSLDVTVERRSDGSLLLKSSSEWQPDNGCVHDWLLEWAEKTPEANFLCERGGGTEKWIGISYGEAAKRVRSIAASLVKMELDDRRPILIISENTIDHQLLSLAASLAGIPFSPISVAYSKLESALPKLELVLDVLNPGLVYASDGSVFFRALSIKAMAGRILVVSSNVDAVAGAVSLRSLENTASLDAGAGPTADSIVKFIFTSGSTGSPKGVITTHRMIRNDVCAVATCLPHNANPMVAIDWLPWSHVYGGSFGIGTALRSGGTLYIDDGRPISSDFDRTIENLQGISPTIFWNVPKAYEYLSFALMKDEALCKSFFKHLKVMLYGAASLPESVLDTMNGLVARYAPHDIPMLPAWGLTETTTMASFASTPAIVPSSIGLPLPGVELKLVPSGDKLEARVRGPIVTPGYWALPDVTASAFDEEGFFKTGDAMRLFDGERPELGLVFEGRVAEDFKLLSGTWVNVTEIRSRCLTALSSLAADVVVAGPDRDELALLIFPSKVTVATDAGYLEHIRDALESINRGVSGSSRVIARAIIVVDPPVASAGELTEKGSLNSRLILQRRKNFVDRLYDNGNPDVILYVRQPSIDTAG